MRDVIGRVVRVGGALGCDTDTALTPGTPVALRAAGYRFVMRYVDNARYPRDPLRLTSQEAEEILASGLMLGIVQHARGGDGGYGTSTGGADGEAAAQAAAALGVPSGVTLWCDFEPSTAPTSQRATDYLEAWYSAVSGAGFSAGLYVSTTCGLTSQQLYSDLSFSNYWRSGICQVPVDTRGYQIQQGPTTSVEVDGGSLSIDPDLSVDDFLGGSWFAVSSTGG